MSIVNTSIHLYRRLLRVLNFLQCPFLLFVRVYWGWQFWQTGWGKLQDISKPIGFFTELGIPFPVFNAWFVSMLECVGGILLILGLASRLISIPLVIDKREWGGIEQAISQRATLLNEIISDLYGEQRLLRDGQGRHWR